MPRYFFNIRDGRDVFDTVGTELANLRAVRMRMMAAATEIVEEDPRKTGDWEMEVLDETGKIVFTMDFNVRTERF